MGSVHAPSEACDPFISTLLLFSLEEIPMAEHNMHSMNTLSTLYHIIYTVKKIKKKSLKLSKPKQRQ